MIHRDHVVPNPVIDLGVCFQRRTGSQSLPAERVHWLFVSQVLSKSERCAQSGDIGWIGQEIVHDPHECAWIGRAQRYLTPAPRMEQHRMNAERIFIGRGYTGKPYPSVERRRKKQKFYVRRLDLRPRSKERLQSIRQHGRRTRSEQPGLSHGEGGAIGPHQLTERPWIEARPSQPDL